MRTNTNRHPSDLLGELQQQIVALQIREKDLKARLIAKGEGTHCGELFAAVVVFSTRCFVPAKVARAKLRELITDKRWWTRHEVSTDVQAVTVEVLAVAQRKAA
jgi:hypothetical protein